jgi:DNA processing protein
MTLDESVALSLVENLPRVGLTARLKAGDPALRALAAPLVESARAVRLRAERQGIGVLPWDAPEFPAALTAIPDCPPALWYRGQLAVLEAPAVAVVGSRAASSVAMATAERLAADLAGRGVAVVSGLARGVDSAAHRGALRTGCTIAVLGSGVDRIYPPEHAPLATQIALEGVVVSEYGPGTPPLPFHFPMRNRLISGLSRAVVVIEASEKSGSLITAACALEQGREVMAVPGTVLNGRNRGGHALLRDGATIVESADDVVGELGYTGQLAGPKDGHVTSSNKRSSTDTLVRVMEVGHPYDLDELTASSGLDVVKLLPRLLDLELRGLVRRAGAGRFLRSS